MTEPQYKRRLLTIRVNEATTQPDDYLRMLDIPLSPETHHASELWMKRARADESAPLTGPRSLRPRMLLAKDLGPDSPNDPSLAAEPLLAPQVGSAALQGRVLDKEQDKEWKLSVRLDRGLLSELYGAAEQLSTSRATVSSMVEEALRLYLPRLREHHNGGRPFPERGPKSRSVARTPMLATPTPGAIPDQKPAEAPKPQAWQSLERLGGD